jgi:hypothetical protein
MSRHLETAKWDDRRFRIERRVLSVRCVCRSQKCFFKKVMFMIFKGGKFGISCKAKNVHWEYVTRGTQIPDESIFARWRQILCVNRMELPSCHSSGDCSFLKWLLAVWYILTPRVLEEGGTGERSQGWKTWQLFTNIIGMGILKVKGLAEHVERMGHWEMLWVKNFNHVVNMYYVMSVVITPVVRRCSPVSI